MHPTTRTVPPSYLCVLLLATVAVTVAAPGRVLGQPEVGYWIFGGRGGHPWAEFNNLNVLMDERSHPGALQPRELRPDVNALPDLFGRFPFERVADPPNPLWTEGMPRLWRGSTGPSIFGFKGRLSLYVDGDPSTFWWVTNFGPGGSKTLGEYYTISPGAPLPLERFVLSLPPREMVDQFGEPWENYVPRQGELSASLTRTANVEGIGEYRPLARLLGRIQENLVAPIEFSFPLQYFRFVRWRTFPDVDSGISVPMIFKLAYAEFELYGRGFAGESRFETRVADLAQPVILGKVDYALSQWRRRAGAWTATGGGRRWQPGELVPVDDAQAGLQIRFKTGRSPDPRRFTTYNDFGELTEVDFATWQSLKFREWWEPEFVGWQGPVDDARDWTGWSGPIDPGTRPGLASGRYFQVKVEMDSRRPGDMVRLDSLRIELLPVLAPTLLGEVAALGMDEGDHSVHVESPTLTRVAVGSAAALTYAIRAGFTVNNGGRSGGFDAIRIATPSPPRFLRLRMGSPPMGRPLQEVVVTEEDVLSDTSGLTLFLPDRVDQDTEIRIDLSTVLYTVSARLHGEVFNRLQPEVSQSIDEGDATDRIMTNQLLLVTSGGVPETLGDLLLHPRVVTPNGDGRNDHLELSYVIFGVLESEVDVSFFSLSGQRVRQLLFHAPRPGLQEPVRWDGRDDRGRLLPPGLYLCQVQTQTSRGRSTLTRSVAVAY